MLKEHFWRFVTFLLQKKVTLTINFCGTHVILRREKLSDKIYALNIQKEKINVDLKEPETLNTAEKIFKDFSANEIVTEKMISLLVNKIYISSNKEIEINWNFKDIFNFQI